MVRLNKSTYLRLAALYLSVGQCVLSKTKSIDIFNPSRCDKKHIYTIKKPSEAFEIKIDEGKQDMLRTGFSRCDFKLQSQSAEGKK